MKPHLHINTHKNIHVSAYFVANISHFADNISFFPFLHFVSNLINDTVNDLNGTLTCVCVCIVGVVITCLIARYLEKTYAL